MTTPAPEPTPDPTPPTPTPTPAPTPAPDKGYPENTPVADMKPEEQAAYWRAQSRKHEDRYKSWSDTLGGKTADQIKTELDELGTLRTAQLTDAEKAVEQAKKDARAEAAAEFAPKLASVALNAALAHVKDEDRQALLEPLDLSKFISTNGDVDTAKVAAFASKVAPSDTGTGKRQLDFGGGRRDSHEASGVGAGAELFAARRKKS